MFSEYRLLGGEHPETAAVRNMLAFHGVTAPHTGEPFTEAMLLGIGGGVGGGYWVFEFDGIPPAIALGARHEWQRSPGLFIPKICNRIGVTATVNETSGRKGAEKSLLEVLRSGNPAAVAVDMASIPHTLMPGHLIKYYYHLLVVCGIDETAGTLELDDRAPTPFEVTIQKLADARQMITSMKHRMVTIARSSNDIDLASAINAGIADCIDGLLNPPIRNFGLPAWQKWADLIANPKDKKGWPNVFSPGPNLYSGLQSMFQWIECAGNGGSLMRGMFADFLDEASDVISDRGLADHARRWRDIAGQWTALAHAALPNTAPLLRETRELLLRRDEIYLHVGEQGLDEVHEINERLTELQSSVAKDGLLGQAQSLPLFQEVRERLLAIHAAELDATTVLAG